MDSLRLGDRGAVFAGAMPGSPMRMVKFLHGMLPLMGLHPANTHTHAIFNVEGATRIAERDHNSVRRPGLLTMLRLDVFIRVYRVKSQTLSFGLCGKGRLFV